MANTRNNRNIFGRKIVTPEKNIREPISPSAATAIMDVATLCNQSVLEIFRKERIKSGYRNIIMVLGKEDGISQLAIAKANNLKPSTISIGLKRMEHDGYVVRVNDPQDMRMTRVYLTEKGRDLADRAYNTMEEIYKIFLQNVSDEEQDAVIAAAEKMKQNYQSSNYAKRDEI